MQRLFTRLSPFGLPDGCQGIEFLMNDRKNNWLLAFLGRILFPSKVPWQQRANAAVVVWTLAAGVVSGGVIVAFLLLRGLR